MGMIDVLKKRWRYFTAKTDSRFEANADPKVQLEQAIADAQEQHRRLVEQAANVVANQKQHELQLNRAMEELGKVNASTRQALVMAAGRLQAGRHRQGPGVQPDRRGLRQPAHRHREPGQRPQDAQPAVRPGRRPGPGRGTAELDWPSSRSWPSARSCCPSSTRPRCRNSSTGP